MCAALRVCFCQRELLASQRWECNATPSASNSNYNYSGDSNSDGDGDGDGDNISRCGDNPNGAAEPHKLAQFMP
jgi:hypothetical protein